MPQKLSRRDFLKVTGLTLGGAMLSCSGLGYLATRTPEITTPELTLGKEYTTNKPILVAYATRAGSTGEIAAAIGETLAARGFRVEVRPVTENPTVTDYQAIILGSAIRMGNWLPEMVKFIEANQHTLNQMPVALFTVHMLNAGEDETSRAARAAYTAPIHALLPDAPQVFFTGLMDFSRLSFLDRFISRMVKAVESDQRDWEKIRAWAETISIG